MASRWQQRRLRHQILQTHAELISARAAVQVAEQQLVAFVDDADEAQTRSLVSENRLDIQLSQEAARHREVMERALQRSRDRVEELSAKEIELLTKLE